MRPRGARTPVAPTPLPSLEEAFEEVEEEHEDVGDAAAEDGEDTGEGEGNVEDVAWNVVEEEAAEEEEEEEEEEAAAENPAAPASRPRMDVNMPGPDPPPQGVCRKQRARKGEKS